MHRQRVKKYLKGRPLLVVLCILLLLGFVGYGWLSHPSRTHSSESKSSSSTSSSEKKDSFPDVKSSDWNLVLVNREHPTNRTPDHLVTVEDIQMDSRIEQAAKDFLTAIRQFEPEETLNSGYRSKDDQTALYNEAVAAQEAAGLTHEEAETEVQKQIQIPGASEHQTGLALDISVPTGQSDEEAERIAALAPQYGFILRYPKDKSDVTGVDFENWHYRYVGKTSAAYMYEHKLVLEEYVKQLQEVGK